MHLKTQVYNNLRETIAKLPVIDCHDHTFRKGAFKIQRFILEAAVLSFLQICYWTYSRKIFLDY